MNKKGFLSVQQHPNCFESAFCDWLTWNSLPCSCDVLSAMIANLLCAILYSIRRGAAIKPNDYVLIPQEKAVGKLFLSASIEEKASPYPILFVCFHFLFKLTNVFRHKSSLSICRSHLIVNYGGQFKSLCSNQRVIGRLRWKAAPWNSM